MLFCEAEPARNPSRPDIPKPFRGARHVHLMSTNAKELHAYAAEIGMMDWWVHIDRHGIPHYDCTGRYMWQILRDDRVAKLSRREFVDQYRAVQADRAYERSTAPERKPATTNARKIKPECNRTRRPLFSSSTSASTGPSGETQTKMDNSPPP